MLPNINDLYEPYSADADLKTSILYWEKEARNLGIPEEIRDAAIIQTFLEMTNGKTFPIGSCDCGCEFPVKWSSVAINHYVIKKMLAMKGEIDFQKAELITANIHRGMLAIIEAKNAEFVAEQMAEEIEEIEEIELPKQFDLFIWIKDKFDGLVSNYK